MREGIRKEGVLSPILFNVLIDDVMRATGGKTKKIQVGKRQLKTVDIGECAFADDKNEKDW